MSNYTLSQHIPQHIAEIQGHLSSAPDCAQICPAAPPPGHSWLDIIELQRFNSLYDSTPSATVSLGRVLDHIVEGKYAPLIEQARQILATHGEKAYSVFKRRLPQFTFTGVFAPTRTKANLVQHSGIVHADLDHLADLQQIKLQLHLDPHVVYVFRSPSNNGLKYGVRIAPVDSDEAYRNAWQAIAEAHLRQYNITWDASGCDVSRTCFVSWDATCFVNPDAEVFPVPPMVVPAPQKVILRAPYSRPLAESAASRALERAIQMIDTAVVGSKHAARRSASYLLGGYIGGGLLPYDEAYAALEAAVARTATDPQRAMQTIVSGLRAGQARPITDSTLTANALARTGSHWRTQTISPEEIAPWRG